MLRTWEGRRRGRKGGCEKLELYKEGLLRFKGRGGLSHQQLQSVFAQVVGGLSSSAKLDWGSFFQSSESSTGCTSPVTFRKPK
jgi:hypothetical protein